LSKSKGASRTRFFPSRSMVLLEIDTDIYPDDAVMGAAYVFIDRCYVRLEKAGQDRKKIVVRLKAKNETGRHGLEELAGGFENELLHQAWRIRLEQSRGRLREYILARALLTAQDDDSEEETRGEHIGQEPGDYLEDPLGIAVPWEEKFGKDGKGG